MDGSADDAGGPGVVAEGGSSPGVVASALKRGRKRKGELTAKLVLKMPKVDAASIKETKELPAGNDLLRVPITGGAGKKAIVLNLIVKPHYKRFVTNEGAQEANPPPGYIICGFGRGQFQILDAAAPVDGKLVVNCAGRPRPLHKVDGFFLRRPPADGPGCANGQPPVAK